MVKAWAIILPTFLYLYMMFELIVKFTSADNYYSFVNVFEQAPKDGKAFEAAYQLRPFVSILMFITIDFVS